MFSSGNLSVLPKQECCIVYPREITWYSFVQPKKGLLLRWFLCWSVVFYDMIQEVVEQQAPCGDLSGGITRGGCVSLFTLFSSVLQLCRCVLRDGLWSFVDCGASWSFVEEGGVSSLGGIFPFWNLADHLSSINSWAGGGSRFVCRSEGRLKNRRQGNFHFGG